MTVVLKAAFNTNMNVTFPSFVYHFVVMLRPADTHVVQQRNGRQHTNGIDLTRSRNKWKSTSFYCSIKRACLKDSCVCCCRIDGKAERNYERKYFAKKGFASIHHRRTHSTRSKYKRVEYKKLNTMSRLPASLVLSRLHTT